MFPKLLAFVLVFSPHIGQLVQAGSHANSNHAEVCRQIGRAFAPSSKVYYPGNSSYEAAIDHWTPIATQTSACVVEPATAKDVGTVLQIVGKTRTPFAVKGGGHHAKPGASSTTGVHISMAKFSGVRYNNKTKVVEVGAGCIWKDVYTALAPYGVGAVGGRSNTVGVAGFTLGGGYSWLTNQHGLAIDTVVAFELVKPDGKVEKVDARSNPDLFNGLKGGINNFGIVTKFYFQSYPQPGVWGGQIIYHSSVFPQLMAAIQTFEATVTDPKATLLPVITRSSAGGEVFAAVAVFYDSPIPPPSHYFEAFFSIPSIFQDVGTKSFLEFSLPNSDENLGNKRIVTHTVSVIGYGPNFLDAIANQSTYWHDQLPPSSNFYFALEPFLPSIYSHNTAPTAFPFSRQVAFSPLALGFFWDDATDDSTYIDALRQTVDKLIEGALKDGDQTPLTAPLYSNYARDGTGVDRLWGSRLPGLRALKRRVDPKNVMGLAGGFKIPL